MPDIQPAPIIEQPRTNGRDGLKTPTPTRVTEVREATVVKKGFPIKRVIFYTIFAAALIYGGIFAYNTIMFGRIHESTDDAQIDANISPVLPRIGGYITSVSVADNQYVHEGDIIATIDKRDLELKVHTAQAALQTAEASALAARANVGAAEVTQQKTVADLERDRRLLTGGALTQEQFQSAKAAADVAQAQNLAVTKQIAVAEANVEQKKVDLEFANLQLSYATVFAPVSGFVSKKNVEVGQLVEAGQPLMALAEDTSIWVTANFKETQLSDIMPGQKVDIVADAFDNITFHGIVQSISGATGAKFALLPPDNSTGNFVKVTQRVPVKITLTGPPNAKYPLRPGMSVVATITTGSN